MNKKMTLQRTLVFAAIAVVVLATTAVAAGKIYSTGSHSNRDDAFTQMPTASQMEKVIKATPTVIEQFDNGFVFTEGLVVHAEDMDESGAVLSKYQMLDFTYSNAGKSVTLTMEQKKPDRTPPEASKEITYQGTTLWTYGYTQKTVPLGYVKTEQDLKEEAAGTLHIGTMGEDTIETETVQMVGWTDEAVSYMLHSQGTPVAQDELVEMAKQMIDQP